MEAELTFHDQQKELAEIGLSLGDLDITSDDFLLEEVDVHIQENLEDEIVKEALKTRMEEMLNGFQSDLSSISTEIQSLQEQSVAMNVKLKNRQSIRGELSQHILDTAVTEREFLEQLHELNHKINFVKEQSFRDAKSSLDVRDILEKLKIKAITKIREFLLQKINSFKKPMTNYQIPQNTMLKFRFFNEFLLGNERHVAKEVRDEYVDTMSKIYFSYFKGYLSRLMKLQNRSTVFTIGKRGDILTTELEAPIIVPHAAQKSDNRSLFRSLHFALMDNSSREYLFLTDFFMASETTAIDLFNVVLGKTLSIYLKGMEEHINDCYDSIAMFLCIHIVHRYRTVMADRGVPSLERYFESLLHTLWVRFEFILVLNIQSVRDCDPEKLGTIDARPNYITRRYAEYSAAILGINQSYPDERVYRILDQLQTEVENFILKLAAEFPHRKEQLIFLINNYDMMLGVISERTSEDSKESESFKELLTARTHEFIDEVLTPHFGGMIMFVKDCEGLVERGNLDALKTEERRVSQIVRGFNADWKRALEYINQEVMRSFTNFKNGTQILQGALTQLIQYYHRFQKVLNQGSLRHLQIRNELINIHHVMVETALQPNT
ncbi:VPS52-like protein [Mya arenaria]|uniref:Vacuolar protein sorting-associated protein 52 homolog n=1 Tax=Mya arenaria TaxID=6604 RepID=A0ABY7GDN7_MYAAR|nr:VPS52-like protein [Mya arenaria]